MDHPGGPIIITRILESRELFLIIISGRCDYRGRGRGMGDMATLEDRKKVQESRSIGETLEAGKGNNNHSNNRLSPRASRKECRPVNSLTLAQ